MLIPSLRQQAGIGEGSEEEMTLQERYAQGYAGLAGYLERESYQHPEPVYALVRRELPNLRKALELLLQTGELEATSSMADKLTEFLGNLGLTRERDQMRRRVRSALAAIPASADGGLTHAEYLREIGGAGDEQRSGKTQAAYTRISRILVRIQALPEGAEDGPGSYSHCCTLQELGYCLREAGQLGVALGTIHLT